MIVDCRRIALRSSVALIVDAKTAEAGIIVGGARRAHGSASGLLTSPITRIDFGAGVPRAARVHVELARIAFHVARSLTAQITAMAAAAIGVFAADVVERRAAARPRRRG